VSSLAFSERFTDLGDSAEDAFRTWAANNRISVEEWGLKRPNFVAFKDLPKNVRHEPDFICESLKKHKTPIAARHFFVEAKGVGKDQIIKIKYEDLETVAGSIDFHGLPCYFFVNDVAKNRVGVFEFMTLMAHMLDRGMIHDTFWEGKKYVGIPTTVDWFLLWENK
jgi:hypothetical protein